MTGDMYKSSSLEFLLMHSENTSISDGTLITCCDFKMQMLKALYRIVSISEYLCLPYNLILS